MSIRHPHVLYLSLLRFIALILSPLSYIRKFGHQSVLEKIGSNVMRNAHSQFDILMGICQAHILSFGASGDTESVASSVRFAGSASRAYLLKITDKL